MTRTNGDGEAERLDRYWDDFLHGRAVHPGGAATPGDGLDPDLAAAVRRLHALDDAPAPDPALAARLWPSLVPPTEDAPATGGVRRAAAAARPVRLIHPAVGRPVVELIAAALLLAVLGGSLGGRGVLPTLTGRVPTASAQVATATAAALACLPSPTPRAEPPTAFHDDATARPTPGAITHEHGCD